MKVLQIVNDYMGTKLYSLLFHEIYNNKVDNEIFVPLPKQNESMNVIREGEGHIIMSPCYTSLDRILYFRKQEKIVKRIVKEFDLRHISIIHAHTLFSSGYAAMKLKEKYGNPYIIAVRNVDINIFFKKIIWLKSTGIEIMKNAKKVIFLSPSYQRYVNDNYIPMDIRDDIQKKCEVIPNGISKLFLKNKNTLKKIGNNKIHLIYVGEINKNKNLITTIKAAEILKNQGVDISITCIGDIVEEKCKKWLDSDLVQYYPKCSQEALLKHYRAADIFVMPSHTETFGLVYAEAMSQGLPVIYTRGQGFDGHFPDGEIGYAVSSNDDKEIAHRIVDIMSNYEAISGNCLRCVDKFDWEIIAKKYVEIYKDCSKRNN